MWIRNNIRSVIKTCPYLMPSGRGDGSDNCSLFSSGDRIYRQIWNSKWTNRLCILNIVKVGRYRILRSWAVFAVAYGHCQVVLHAPKILCITLARNKVSFCLTAFSLVRRQAHNSVAFECTNIEVWCRRQCEKKTTETEARPMCMLLHRQTIGRWGKPGDRW